MNAPVPAPAKLDPAKLAFEVALGYYTPDELCTQFGIDTELFAALMTDQRFQRAISSYKREIDEAGTQFQVKARKVAGLVIEELGAIALNPLAAASDRISAIRELARFAGYAALAENPTTKPLTPPAEPPDDPEQLKAYTLKALAKIVDDPASSSNDRLNALREISRLRGLSPADGPPQTINISFVRAAPPPAPAPPTFIDVTPATDPHPHPKLLPFAKRDDRSPAD